jgi:prepilin-type N-terminal cleavage/methylation domain-containing protein
MKKKGFTMIELLVVIAITAMLSSIAIIYSHVGQNQIALSIEASKIGELILQAKELSIATYSQAQNTCAYGIHFDYPAQNYSLFEYNMKSSGFCPSIASTTALGGMKAPGAPQQEEYSVGSWNVHIARGVVMLYPTSTPASDTIEDILFYPPNPFTFINFIGNTTSGQGTFTENPTPGNIYLRTSDGSESRTVTINSSGQVSL